MVLPSATSLPETTGALEGPAVVGEVKIFDTSKLTHFPAANPNGNGVLIWGVSASGHLAGVVLTTPANNVDFGILSYLVLTLEGPYAHLGSVRNLIGENTALASGLSVQNRVSATTPPNFIFHTSNDEAVTVQNSLLYVDAMAKHSRPFQLCILPDEHHGLGLALDAPVHNWTSELKRFLTYSIGLAQRIQKDAEIGLQVSSLISPNSGAFHNDT